MNRWPNGYDSISLCMTVANLPPITYQVLCLALGLALIASLIGWLRERRRAQREHLSCTHQRDELLAATADQRRLTELLQAIVDGTTDAVFVKDRQGKYLLLNEATSKFVGRPIHEVLGRDDRDLFPPAHAEFLMTRDRIIMDSNTTSTAEELLTAAGVTRTFLAVKAPYRNSAGEVIGLVGVSRDITERKQMESDLRQALKMEAVGRLAGGIAHDFNNLLTVIKGYCELLLHAPGDRNTPAVDWRTSINEIREAGDRAARLTSQLLAFSRRAIVKPASLCLNRSIQDIRPLMGRLVSEAIDVRIRLDESLPAIWADSTQIEQLLVNLIVNARDAMPEGGQLEIETSARVFESESPLLDQLIPAGRYVELTIRDSGRGIDAEMRSKIFDPFFSPRPGRQGPGLELSVVQAVVAECAGYVGIECPETGGTTFRILLPVHSGAEAQPRPATPSVISRDLTILVVEDDLAVQTIIKTLLQSKGYRVLIANSGNEAIETANSVGSNIDLLLTDVVMPGMSGRELAERLRHQWPDIRVLFMSGYTDDTVLRNGIIKQDSFVGKPFTLDVLYNKVREVLTGA